MASRSTPVPTWEYIDEMISLAKSLDGTDDDEAKSDARDAILTRLGWRLLRYYGSLSAIERIWEPAKYDVRAMFNPKWVESNELDEEEGRPDREIAEGDPESQPSGSGTTGEEGS